MPTSSIETVHSLLSTNQREWCDQTNCEAVSYSGQNPADLKHYFFSHEGNVVELYRGALFNLL